MNELTEMRKRKFGRTVYEDADDDQGPTDGDGTKMENEMGTSREV